MREMPQPPAYLPSFSFAGFEANAPSEPKPGPEMDAQFEALSDTLKAVLANLAKIQRDDGALKNALVTLDSLSPAAIVALGAGSQWTVRGEWVAATAYAVSDVVKNGSITAVCAVQHVAGDFDADVASGSWVKLFDEAGSIPEDGSVTTPKLVDGAVTEAKIGFTQLDLSGSCRFAGGAFGTAPLGAFMHGKRNAGDAHAKVERATDAQGAVGVQIIGAGATWTLEQAAGSNNLQLRDGATVRMTFRFGGGVNVPGAVRAIAGTYADAGLEIGYAGGIGYLTSYDYLISQWKDLKVRGKDVYLTAGGVDVFKATSTGVEALKDITRGGQSLGYMGIPQNKQSGAYTLKTTDNGGHTYSENVGAQTITLRAFGAADAAIDVGWTHLIINDGTNNITVPQASGVAQRLAAGSTGTRTIAPGGMCFIECVKRNRFFFSGPGVT